MRFVAKLIFIILSLAAGTAKADIIVASGLLKFPNGSPAGGYEMHAYIDRFWVGRDTTLQDGMYTIVSSRPNIDSRLLKFSYIICKQGREYARSSLDFVSVPDNIFQAKVPNLTLVSTARARYTREEATEAIGVVMTVEAIQANAGEIQANDANEHVAKEAAKVLERTDLGDDPKATMRKISETIRMTFDKALPQLPLLQENQFLGLLHLNEPLGPRMTARCDPTSQEQTDLSGTYTGKVKTRNEPALDATLTITGNSFTMTAGSEMHSGRITAVTTCGYTAVTMMKDLTPPTSGPNLMATVQAISLQARRAGTSLTLISVPGEPRIVMFTTQGAAMRPRRRR